MNSHWLPVAQPRGLTGPIKTASLFPSSRQLWKGWVGFELRQPGFFCNDDCVNINLTLKHALFTPYPYPRPLSWRKYGSLIARNSRLNVNTISTLMVYECDRESISLCFEATIAVWLPDIMVINKYRPKSNQAEVQRQNTISGQVFEM